MAANKIKSLLGNGTNLSLLAAGALALAGVVSQRRGGGGFGGFNGAGDDYWGEEQWTSQQQWGSQAMSYTEFTSRAIPQYVEQGMSSKDAMRAAAADWRAMTGG